MSFKRSLLGIIVCGGIIAAFSPARVQAQDDGRTKFVNPTRLISEEEEELLFFTTRVAFYSDYIYRGLPLYRGVSIQPSGGAFLNLGEAGTLGVSVWMQVPAEDDQEVITFTDANGVITDEFETNRKFFELDTTLSYDITFDIVTLSVGHIWYTDPGYSKETAILGGETVTVPEIAPDTSELYAGFPLDIPLHPQFTVYRDYRTIDYEYYSLEFSEPFDIPALGEGFNLTPFVNFGFADDDIYNKNGLVHVNVGVASDLQWGIFALKPSFVYIFETDGRDEGGPERAENNFVFGIDISYDFGV